MAEHHLTLRVNGHERSATVESRRTLADFLREDLRLTGTHLGCEHGVCGACTVLLDQAPVRACLMFAVQADGAEIETVESLARERLNDLQESFREHQGLQCGFCTPGILMTATALLRETPNASDEQIRDAVGGHLCRCTGYVGVLAAIRAVAQDGASATAAGAES